MNKTAQNNQFGSNSIEDAVARAPEQLELTTFTEGADRTLDVRKTSIVPSMPDNPYFTESLVQWLSRPFPVLTANWTEADVSGARIGTVYFPEALFSINSIYQKLQNLAFFRAGVRISLRINGTKFHYGKLLIMWSPQSLNTGELFERTDNVYSASGYPHVIASATENEVHEFVMPFCLPFPYIDLVHYPSQLEYFNMGGVFIYVLNPLKLNNDPVPPVSISLFANFEDVQIGGYTANPLPILTPTPIPSQLDIPNPQEFNYPILEAQMFVLPELIGAATEVAEGGSLLSEMGTIGSGIGDEISSIGSYFAPAAEVPSVAETIVPAEVVGSNSVVTPLPEVSESIFETPNVSGAEVVEMGEEPELAVNSGALSLTGMIGKTAAEMVAHAGNVIDKEAVGKSSSGLISGVAETISKATSLFAPMPIIGTYAALASKFSGAVGAVAKSLGYCNPVSQESIHRMKLHNPMFANTHGLDNSVTLGIAPDNKVSPCFELLGGFPEEQTLRHLLSTPSLLTIVEIFGDEVPGTSVIRFPVMPSITRATASHVFPPVLKWVTDPFHFWRGSIKYAFQITASSFHSCRLRISWEPNDINPLNEEYYNTVGHVLDIQEETEFRCTIPYLQPISYKNTNFAINELADANGFLNVSIVNSLVHPESPIPSIFLNIWTMGGEDFQVAAPYLYNMQHLDTAPLEAQWSTRESMRSSPYPPLIPARGFTEVSSMMGEDIVSIKDIIKRPRATRFAPESLTYNPYGNLDFKERHIVSTDVNREMCDFLTHYQMMFRFARGSFNARVISYRQYSTGVITDTIPSQSNVYFDTLGLLEQSTIHSINGNTDESAYYLVQQGSYRSSDLTIQPLETMLPYYNAFYGMVNNGYRDEYKSRTGVFRIHSSSNCALYTYPGDDYELIFQVGIPRVNRFIIPV